MLNIKKIKRKSRALFENEKPIYRLEVKLTVLDNYFVFVGSSKDEIFQLEEHVFEKFVDLDIKLEQIKKYIKPMNSTIFIDGQPYIAGSTLKGMIRFHLEHSFKESNNIYSCFIKQNKPKPKDEIKNFLEAFNYWPNVPKKREEEITKVDRYTKVLPEDFCKVCDMFGNTNLASRIIISDAKPLAKIQTVPITIIAKYEERKRVIPPNSQFSFTINLNNAEIEDLALLFIGMNFHNDGTLLLGMHKFSPKNDKEGNIIQFGKIKLEITKVTKYNYDKNGFDEAIIDLNNFTNNIKEEINKFGNILRNYKES